MAAIALLPLVAAGWLSAGSAPTPATVLDAARDVVAEAQRLTQADRVEVTIFNVNYPATDTVYIGRDGAVDDATRKQLEGIFKCKRTKRQHAIDRQLLVMLADVAAQYPGKTIEYVSAYRAVDPRESRHRQGRAFDFRIPGVPLTELRDYVWTHHTEVGVGWYPQSNFIHMDHRPGAKDYAWTQIGPTEHGNPSWSARARRAEPPTPRPRHRAGV
ncbi:MAG: DUF882 domain-containing protein [Myxococcales bacterium]|nr:DUF882 domain-containing protein [Myxococcales bacterium]